jgi:hypothetical protein
MCENNPIKDLLDSINSPKDVRNSIIDQYKHLDVNNITQLYIYGAGQDARNFIAICKNLGIKILGVYDDNIDREGENFEGHCIQCLQKYPIPALIHL